MTARLLRASDWLGTMLKPELVQRIVAQTMHLYHRDVARTVDAMLGEIRATLARGDRVQLRGFGTFSIKHRSARTVKNPKTGTYVSVEQKNLPFFKSGKQMHVRLNRYLPSATEPG
jgi:integration host factor subunit beta